MGKRSRLWYAIPILFGLPVAIGFFFFWHFGIIFKKDRSDFPLKFLILGAIISGITWTLKVVEIGLVQRFVQRQLPDIIFDTVPIYSLLT